MNTLNEIVLLLGRIEGELIQIRKMSEEIRRISERVRGLEIWQSRLRGAWLGLLAAYACLCRQILRFTHIF
jgi:hypothetical protein